MASAYTHGIINGEINDFKTFATQCIKAFGIDLDMSDEPNKKTFIPSEPNKYYLEEEKKAKTRLRELKKKTLEDIERERIEWLKNKIQQHKEDIYRTKETSQKLEAFLDSAKKYVPPTYEHVEIKDFMIQQLESTISRDGDYSFYETCIKEHEKNLNNFDVRLYKKELIESAEEDINYFKSKYAKSISECIKSNKFAQDFFKSLN